MSTNNLLKQLDTVEHDLNNVSITLINHLKNIPIEYIDLYTYIETVTILKNRKQQILYQLSLK